MLTLIAKEIEKISEILTQEGIGLEDKDTRVLNDEAPTILRTVKENIEQDKKPFEGLSDEDKRVLLAFVVYKRQNITTEETDNPNDEDAARILHKDVYKPNEKESEKEVMKRLEKDLKKQLSKAGLPIE